ncbi:hypothetical protein [Streptomyces sp. NPDC048606]|uniref:hypothetical protein n=1 Tax=Streptomyces sp. NPDC048606 TaxID=3154726 RepID=UPI003415D182
MSFGGQNPYGPTWYPHNGQAPPPPGMPPQAGPYPHNAYPASNPYTVPGQYPYPGAPTSYPYGPPRPRSLGQQFRDGDWPTLRELLRRARVPGCAWVAVLFCFSPVLLFLLLYPLVRSARVRAHAKFPAHAYRRVPDPQVLRVQKTRAVVALVASSLILVVYGTEADFAELQGQYMLRLAITPWLLLLTAPAVILLLFRLAPPAARPGMRARLRPAVRSALWYFGAFTAVPLLFVGVMLLGEVLPSPLITLGLLLAPLWLLLFVGFASLTVVRHAFGTSEVHAALPALLTGVLVWELAAINLAVTGMPPGPPFLQISALIGGPASVSAVAWWEIFRLRTRYGVRLRSH